MKILTETLPKKNDLIAEIVGGREGSIEYAMTLIEIRYKTLKHFGG